MCLQSVRKSVLVIVASSLVAACGGGGSGGGDDDSSNSEASSRSSLAMDSNGYSTRKASLNTQEDFQTFSEVFDTHMEAFNLVYDVEEALTNGSLEPVIHDSRQSNIMGDEVTDIACENGGGSVRITDDSIHNTEEFVYAFTNCQLTTTNYGKMLLDGTYQFRVTDSTRGGADTLEATETFNMTGKYLPSGKPLALRGDSRFTESFSTDSGEGNVTFSVGTLEFRSGENYVAVKNLLKIISVRSQDVILSDRLTLIGSAMNGYVEYTTPTALSVPRFQEDACPSQGVSRMRGDGVVEIRYGMSTGTGHAVVVEVNNNTVVANDTCQPPETGL